ncbi:hypothetical protein LCGC14_2270750 [marine sediment metagenome]|uniref:Uncharacterized protein n=1 Tax=marine sediment metagenome TaxID=412755 RepID=A0A0F9CXA8_9ZZZZ
MEHRAVKALTRRLNYLRGTIVDYNKDILIHERRQLDAIKAIKSCRISIRVTQTEIKELEEGRRWLKEKD